MISIEKVPEASLSQAGDTGKGERFENKPFARAKMQTASDVVGSKPLSKEIKKKKRIGRQVTPAEQRERVRFVRDAIRAGKNNRDIYALCQKELGVKVYGSFISRIRSGTFTGWGSELLSEPLHANTSDAPATTKPAQKAAHSLDESLRLVVGHMASHKLEKVTIWADGRVETEMVKRQNWKV